MSSSTVIPQDIIDCIVEAVGDDTRSLKICSLVSSEFLLPSRKRLFSRISLSNSGVRSQGLHKFLFENPVLQSFVKTIMIHLNFYDYELEECDSLITTLRLPFCSLESFSISGWGSLHWDDFSSELKGVVSTIIHSSTLKTLHLIRITVPIVLFLGIHLTKLELNSVILQFDLDGGQSKLQTPPVSEEEKMATAASHTVIDRIVWRSNEPVDGLPDLTFLPFMTHLRVLEIYVDPYSTTIDHFCILTFLIRSLHVSFSPPAALEHLKFNITIHINEDMLDNDGYYENIYLDQVWTYLDSMATHPAGSRLQRVDVDVRTRYDDEDSDDNDDNTEESDLEHVFDELPLLRKRGILFANTRKVALKSTTGGVI